MKGLACVCLAVLATTAGAGAEQRWTLATSQNFELYTTAGEKRAREVILHFEKVRSFFIKASHSKPASKGRVRIVAFQTEKEYRPYQLGEGTAGHAAGDRDHSEIVMRGVTSEAYPIAVHEYVHVLLKTFPNLPLWLNEGTAELYSTMKPAGNKVRVGDVPPGHYVELKQSKWLTLDTLLKVDHDSPIYHEKGSSAVFYAQSWALTHMMFLDAAYRDQFSAFLRRVTAGAAQEDAFREAFGKQAWEVEKDLRDYMGRRTFFAALFDVTLEESAEEPDVRAATPLEAGLVLAGVFANANRTEEARRAYEQLAREHPAEPQIPAALGYLAWRSNQTVEARAHFAKAVELGSRSAQLYYDYAGLIDGADTRQEAQARLLSKAVELDPEFRDARFHLAFVLMAQQDYQRALTQFARITRVEPKEAFHFFYSIAFANYRLGNKEEARGAARRAGEYAENPMNRTMVEELQAALTDRPPEAPTPETVAVRTTPQTPGEEPVVVRVLKKPRPSVSGTLVQLDCMDEVARLRLRTSTGEVKLLMEDPRAIDIRGAGAATVTFDCGPQKPRQVTIEYDTATDAKLGTTGVVRSIEFR
jgi:tetratricopeptide (TPR) repeat protein